MEGYSGGTNLSRVLSWKEPNMALQNIISRVRTNLDRQRRLRNVMAEINAMSNLDLADIGASRDEIIRSVRQEILG